MKRDTTRRPQLTLDELQQLKWLLGGVLTLLAVSTVLYMEVEAWTLLVVTSGVTLATMMWPTLPGRVPPLVHTLTFPAIVAFFAADLWLKTEVLPAMVRLDILLLLYRNISYRQRRDELQIIVLGLFLIVVAGVLTVSLTFAVQILVYTACALGLLLTVTLADAARGPAASAKVNFGEVPAWARHANWPQLFRRLREVMDWRIVGLSGLLFVGVVGVSGLLFLAIPRFQLENSMFLDRFISKKAKSGFSETIRFGDVTEILQDSSVALSVDVSDEKQIPASPYWRMLVLDVYDNGGFALSSGLRSQEMQRMRTSSSLQGYMPRQGESVQWTFYLESGVSRYLPLLGHFEALRFREAQNFSYAPRLGVLALREHPVAMTAYRVSGFDVAPVMRDPEFAKLWAARGETAEKRIALQAWLPRFPRDSDVAALRRARDAATGGATLNAAEFARRVSGWLKRNHGYSLSPTIPRGEGDPLVRWLGSAAPGHCELFAGSFVLLARAAGFPARVVTGFRGGTWNAYSNNFTVRNSDAHAWAEIFDEQTGAWLRADPLAGPEESETAAVQGTTALAARMDRSWTARLDSLRVFWYRRIVSFDQRSQAETLKAVKDATRNSGKRLRELFEGMVASVKNWLTTPWDVRRWLGVGGAVGFVAALIWLWRKFGRKWWQRRGGGDVRRDDPVRREAGRWLRKIAEAGGTIPDTSKPETGYRIPEAAKPDFGNRKPERTEPVVAELQRLRFGARATWAEPQTVFRRARQTWREVRRRPG